MVAIAYGVARAAVGADKADKKGFLARFFDGLVEARTRQAEREIARYRYLSRSWQREILAAKGEDLPFGR